jgi:hypothetical protein
MEDEELMFILLEASKCEVGAVIKTNAPERLRQRLYALARSAGLAFRINIPATPGELWLVKKG